jgi:putative flippase GtrA
MKFQIELAIACLLGWNVDGISVISTAEPLKAKVSHPKAPRPVWHRDPRICLLVIGRGRPRPARYARSSATAPRTMRRAATEARRTALSSTVLSARELLRHPFPRFVVSGGTTFIVDLGLLKLLHGYQHLALLPATTVAFLASFSVTFVISRHWTFPAGREGRPHRQAGRFAILVAGNLASTLLVVGGLVALGLYYLLAKLVAVAANSGANFILYRRWVFR